MHDVGAYRGVELPQCADQGRTLAEARAELELAMTASRNELDQLTQKVIAAGARQLVGGARDDDRQLIVRGHAICLDDLHAMEELSGVRLLFDDLEAKREVTICWARRTRRGVRIFIGSENKLFPLSGPLLDHSSPVSRSCRSYRRRARRHRPTPSC